MAAEEYVDLAFEATSVSALMDAGEEDPTGLNWRRIGTKRPDQREAREELTNGRISAALSAKRDFTGDEFTEEEWEKFGVQVRLLPASSPASLLPHPSDTAAHR